MLTGCRLHIQMMWLTQFAQTLGASQLFDYINSTSLLICLSKSGLTNTLANRSAVRIPQQELHLDDNKQSAQSEGGRQRGYAAPAYGMV